MWLANATLPHRDSCRARLGFAPVAKFHLVSFTALGGAAAAATTGRRFRLGKSIHLHPFPRLLSTAVLLLSGRGPGRIVLQDCDGSPDA